MIKVTVFYPAGEGHWFDADYYTKQHAPLSRSVFGSELRGMMIETGVNAGAPGTAPAYLAIGHLFFDNEEAFNSRYLPNAEILATDMLKYTNVEPVLQISTVLVCEIDPATLYPAS